MVIVVIIIVILAIVAIASKGKKKSQLDVVMEKQMALIFPGGKQEIREQVEEVNRMLGGKYDKGDITGALCYMSSLFLTASDKSEDRIAGGAFIRPNNKINKDELIIIYKYVAKKQLAKVFNGEITDSIFQAYYESLGNSSTIVANDVIEGAIGEYGLCASNPIPVKGIPACEAYLKKLKHTSGESFTWKRVFSTKADNIEKPIDVYSLTSVSGTDLGYIYISPYQSVTSNTAPNGFCI